MHVRFPLLRIMFAWLVISAPALWAQDGLREAVSKINAASTLSRSSFAQRLVAADFDNDQKPDGALLVDAGENEGRRMFRIEVHLSTGENRNLTFASDDTVLSIAAVDVNQDGIPDLIVEKAITRQRLQVWLNDGHGKFRQAQVEDFPPLSEQPFRLHAPLADQASCIIGLPSRAETHQALLLTKILRFDSSSSHWRVRPGVLYDDVLTAASHSPRAPPFTSTLLHRATKNEIPN